jgi:hypothetical protein
MRLDSSPTLCSVLCTYAHNFVYRTHTIQVHTRTIHARVNGCRPTSRIHGCICVKRCIHECMSMYACYVCIPTHPQVVSCPSYKVKFKVKVFNPFKHIYIYIYIYIIHEYIQGFSRSRVGSLSVQKGPCCMEWEISSGWCALMCVVIVLLFFFCAEIPGFGVRV